MIFIVILLLVAAVPVAEATLKDRGTRVDAGSGDARGADHAGAEDPFGEGTGGFGSGFGSFSEEAGLEVETPPIDYRTGDEDTVMRKMPGLAKHPDIHMKRKMGDEEDYLSGLGGIPEGRDAARQASAPDMAGGSPGDRTVGVVDPAGRSHLFGFMDTGPLSRAGGDTGRAAPAGPDAGAFQAGSVGRAGAGAARNVTSGQQSAEEDTGEDDRGKSLEDYADQVQFFNQPKAQLRDETTDTRRKLSDLREKAAKSPDG